MRRAIPFGALLAAALAIFGAISTRGFRAAPMGAVGVAVLLAVLAGYAAAGLFWAPVIARKRPEALVLARRFGIAAGLVYVSEVALEYVVLPADNTAWGLVEFGTVFALFLIAGVSAGWRTRRISAGALTGAWTAMASALVWLIVVLAVFYAFRGTGRQAAVLRAEGDFEDFRHSGLADLQVFLMGDFVGAGVFHLLLSPVSGALLGGLGGVAGWAASRVASKG